MGEVLCLFWDGFLLKQGTEDQIIMCLFNCLSCTSKDFPHTVNNCIWIDQWEYSKHADFLFMSVVFLLIISINNNENKLYLYSIFQNTVMQSFIWQDKVILCSEVGYGHS